jgi:hypothetical protein
MHRPPPFAVILNSEPAAVNVLRCGNGASAKPVSAQPHEPESSHCPSSSPFGSYLHAAEEQNGAATPRLARASQEGWRRVVGLTSCTA